MRKKHWPLGLAVLLVLLLALAGLAELRHAGRQDLQAKGTPAPTAQTETSAPVPEPTQEPTVEPTQEPAQEPTVEPTQEPTQEPTGEPTQEPSQEPTVEPVQEPTPEPPSEPEAALLSVRVINRNRVLNELTDGSYYTEKEIYRGDTVYVQSEEEISALYIQWDRPPKPWTLICGEQEQAQGRSGFVHEYVVLPEPCTEVELHLSDLDDSGITEIYAFSAGARPDWVQDWQEPWDNPEILVVATHSDDEFIFMGGLIPKYVDEGRRLQMLYIVRHTGFRRHEMLDSLWTVGVTHYPVMTESSDIYFPTVGQVRDYYGENYVTGVLVEQLRRFRPQVVVGQAEDGDSGHPVHIFGVECLLSAVDLCTDPQEYPESAEKYGVYDVPKVYLHLYGAPENMVTLDYDRPLARFGGATAWEMAELAFRQCVTQYAMGHYEVYGEGSVHDSRKFGLYQSLVGPDTEKNDLFENLPMA